LKQFIIILLTISSCTSFSQSTRQITKDFDGDKELDTVLIDSDLNKLFCSLSTNNYKRISSLEIRSLNFGNTLVETKKGFEFWNDYGRSGWINEFQYNSRLKKMQLIKISRTDYDIDRQKYGDEIRYGSGKSSINLLTKSYVGNFYTVVKDQLKKLPTITATMDFTETFLYCFNDDINFEFEKKCIALYEKAKKETP